MLLNYSMTPENNRGGFIKLDFRKQGGFILGLLIIFFGYFGIICNMVMVNEQGYPIQYTEWENKSFIIYSYETFIQTYFLPAFLLFFLCFFLTYKEDISNYGIKHSIWFVPFIIAFSIIWYWAVSGLSVEPFSLLFTRGEGYLTIFILYAINISGALSGKSFKQYVISKKLK